MSFEQFKRQRAPITNDPWISIQKRGNFSLNPPAFAALKEPAAVEFLYDRETKRIALRSASLGTEFAYPVRPLGKSNWLIAGMAFTGYYGIDTSIARRWIGRLEGDLLVIDLNEPGQEVSSNRDQGRARTAHSNGAASASQLPGLVPNGPPTAVPQVSRPTPNAPEGGGT